MLLQIPIKIRMSKDMYIVVRHVTHFNWSLNGVHIYHKAEYTDINKLRHKQTAYREMHIFFICACIHSITYHVDKLNGEPARTGQKTCFL